MGTTSSKSNMITAEDRAILAIKVQRDKLDQYRKQLQKVIDREDEVAKEALRQNNKRKALLALKKKKFQRQLLDKADAHLNNVEQMVGTIESARVEVDVMKSLKTGNEVLQKIHQEMSLEDVEKLMDDTADTIAYQNELDNLLSGGMTAEDEEELESELDDLVRLEMESKLPKVPDHPLPAKEQEEEEEEEETVSRREPAQEKKPKEPMLAA